MLLTFFLMYPILYLFIYYLVGEKGQSELVEADMLVHLYKTLINFYSFPSNWLINFIIVVCCPFCLEMTLVISLDQFSIPMSGKLIFLYRNN